MVDGRKVIHGGVQGATDLKGGKHDVIKIGGLEKQYTQTTRTSGFHWRRTVWHAVVEYKVMTYRWKAVYYKTQARVYRENVSTRREHEQRESQELYAAISTGSGVIV